MPKQMLGMRWLLLWTSGLVVGAVTFLGFDMLTAAEELSGGADVFAVLGHVLLGSIYGFIGGAIIGATQGLVLNKLGLRGDVWFWATVLGNFSGWGLSGWATLYLMHFAGLPTASVGWWIGVGIALAAIAGLFTGICQGVILRLWHGPAGLWILVTLLAWIAGSAIYWTAYNTTAAVR